MIFTPSQVGQAAYETYRWYLMKRMEARGRPLTMKRWKELAPVTKSAWIHAGGEVAMLLDPDRLPHCKEHEKVTPSCPACIEAILRRH